MASSKEYLHFILEHIRLFHNYSLPLHACFFTGMKNTVNLDFVYYIIACA